MAMTVKDYALLKGCSETTIKNRIRDKKISAVFENGSWIIQEKKPRPKPTQKEKDLRKELRHIKKENSLLQQIRQERDGAVQEAIKLRERVNDLTDLLIKAQSHHIDQFGALYEGQNNLLVHKS